MTLFRINSLVIVLRSGLNAEVSDDFPVEEDILFGNLGADVVDDEGVPGAGLNVAGDADVVFVSWEFPEYDVAGFDVLFHRLVGINGELFGVTGEIEDEIWAAAVVDVGVADEHAGVGDFVGVFLDGFLEVDIDFSEGADDDVGACASVGGDIAHWVFDSVVGTGVGSGVDELIAGGLDDGVERFGFFGGLLDLGGGRLGRREEYIAEGGDDYREGDCYPENFFAHEVFNSRFYLEVSDI